ncbi:hypothetical protein GCM10010961_29260 [Pseudodonghicola xiamenensis]|uniref:Uncharacterized protein n=1 Tax=Pseudodonghicola xiamenensis TaxID=337702 RepID=A0A8J3MFL4_9RHOB|nr:hypothetical protein GCM10010961_29260 [Pseudodonghicola xiamenensis]
MKREAVAHLKARRKAVGTRAPILVEARPNARALSSFAVRTTAGRWDRWISSMTSSRAGSASFAIGLEPMAPQWLIAQRGRRYHPGVPGGDPGHLNLGAPVWRVN